MTAFSRVSELLRRAIGLDPAAVGAARIESAIKRRMGALALSDVAAYAAHVTRDEAERQELIEAVVVPETFFFRERAAMDTLASLLLNGEIQAPPGEAVRILSLPCSTGEEPYSIAITLLAAGFPAAAFGIDALDVSREAIAAARRAVYRPGSFREKDHGFGDYFIPVAGGVTVRADIRRAVRFGVGNVVSPDFSTPQSGYDVIFCRNLLIYFDPPTQVRVMAEISRLLTPEGILFVGAVDAYAARSAGFKPMGMHAPAAFAREGRRRSPRPGNDATRPTAPGDWSFSVKPKLAPRPSAPVEPGGPPSLTGPAVSPATARAREVTAPISEAIPDRAVIDRQSAAKTSAGDPTFDDLCRMADAGRVSEALQLGEVLLATPVADAEAFSLMGSLYEMSGAQDQAEECFRRALYLDPDHSASLLHLALLQQHRGNHERSRRLRQRAERADRKVGS